MNVGSHLAKRALLNPGLEALVDDAAGRRFTFAELDDRANRSAHVLTGRGLGQGRPGRRAAAELPRVRRDLLRRGPRRARRRAAQLAAGRRRAGVHPRATPGRRCSCSAAEFDAVVADLHDRAGDDATPVRDVAARRRRRARRGRSTTTPLVDAAPRRPDRRRRRRRRPAVHHVHLGHDGPAEGRDAHPRQRASGRC